MNPKNVRVAAALLTSLTASPVFAADENTGIYIGVTGGNDTVSISFPAVDDGTATGILFGYRFMEGIGFELTSAATDHEFTGIPGCVMESSTVGMYGAFRTAGKAYLKGRIGLLSEELSTTGACIGITSEGTGMSYGLGGGLRMGKAALEVEYTLIEADVSRISGTLLYNF